MVAESSRSRESTTRVSRSLQAGQRTKGYASPDVLRHNLWWHPEKTTTTYGILDAYAAVERRIKEERVQPTGSPREVYFADEAEAGPNDPFCDVAWPISEGGR